MLIWKSLIAAVVLSLASATAVAENAEFAKPKWCTATSLTPTENLICGDLALSSADMLQSELYRKAMSYKGKQGYEGMWYREVQSDQQDWLAQRNKTTSKEPLLDLYVKRIVSLNQVLQNLWSTAP